MTQQIHGERMEMSSRFDVWEMFTCTEFSEFVLFFSAWWFHFEFFWFSDGWLRSPKSSLTGVEVEIPSRLIKKRFLFNFIWREERKREKLNFYPQGKNLKPKTSTIEIDLIETWPKKVTCWFNKKKWNRVAAVAFDRDTWYT
jgi:hypothetical protein